MLPGQPSKRIHLYDNVHIDYLLHQIWYVLEITEKMKHLICDLK